MKNLVIIGLFVSLVSITGCNATTVAQKADAAITVAINIAQAETPTVPQVDQAVYSNFVSLAQNLNTQLGACINSVGMVSKSAKFLACFNGFASGLLGTQEEAQLKILSLPSQQRVKIFATAVVTAVNIAIVAYNGKAVLWTPTTTTDEIDPGELHAFEAKMARGAGIWPNQLARE